MEGSYEQEKGNKKFTGITTFPVPYAVGKFKENIAITTNSPFDPSKEEKIIKQAFKLHSQGNFQEAANYYQDFLNQGFKDHRVFVNYGNILKTLGKSKEAELLTRKAIELKPDFAGAHFNLGNILTTLGKSKEAETSYLKAIELKPDFAEAWTNLASILKDLGQLEEAELSTRKAIELKPDYSMAHANLGAILIELGILKEAELSTRKAIELKPDFAEAFSNLGNILKDLGQLEEAETSYRKAIELKPDFAEALANLGGLLRELSQLKEAELSTRTAIELKPNFAIAHRNLSLLLCAKGEMDLALKSIENALSIDSISKDNQLLLSVLKSRQKREYMQNFNLVNKEINKKDISSYPIFLNRTVDPELINTLYRIKAIDLNKFQDPSYGNARGSDYKLFEDNEKTTKELEKDLISITKKVTNSDVFFRDSFFTILSGASVITKHNHIGSIDRVSNLNLWKKKYSLVYYLSVGDQNCDNPGILKMYDPDEEILPTVGMIVIFPADRYHSVKYEGTKDRIIIGVNFYSI